MNDSEKQELALEFYDYNQETGDITIKPRDRVHFKSDGDFKMFHTRFAGTIIKRISDKGYTRVYFLDRDYAAHRLIWLMMTGNFPDNQIDHINGIKDDNRWENLRLANNTENCGNQGVRKNNKLGIKGVHKLHSGKYRAQLLHKGKKYNLGLYEDPFEAGRAYQKEAKRLREEFHRDECPVYRSYGER